MDRKNGSAQSYFLCLSYVSSTKLIELPGFEEFNSSFSFLFFFQKLELYWIVVSSSRVTLAGCLFD